MLSYMLVVCGACSVVAHIHAYILHALGLGVWISCNHEIDTRRHKVFGLTQFRTPVYPFTSGFSALGACYDTIY